MKTLALMLLFAVSVAVAAVGDRFVYACRLDRVTAVSRIADVFARHGWEVIDAEPAIGTITARLPRRKAGTIAEVIHVAADGDSLRVICYSYQGDSDQFLAPDEEAYAPVLSHFPTLASNPAEQRR